MLVYRLRRSFKLFSYRPRLCFHFHFLSKLTIDHGINLKITGVQSHNSLGLGERHHDPLHRIYRKLCQHSRVLNHAWILRLVLKAMNDTIGPDGYISLHLVYCFSPRFPVTNTNLPDKKSHILALEIARRKFSILARLRIAHALRARIPPYSKYIIVPGDSVLVYRKTDKKFFGPLTVIPVTEKDVYVRRNKRLVYCNISQVVLSSVFTDSYAFNTLHHLLSSFRSSLPASRTAASSPPDHGIYSLPDSSRTGMNAKTTHAFFLLRKRN